MGPDDQATVTSAETTETRPPDSAPAQRSEAAPAQRSDRESSSSAPSTQARRLRSRDGNWWWNGRRWIPAVTEAGLWRWDGGRWQPTRSFEGRRPEDLAATLSLLAEERYAEAGAILAAHQAEWQPEG